MAQGEVRVFLNAGEELRQVPVPGDFIFLQESARPVRVIIDGQPILMRRGDKRRIQRTAPGVSAFDGFQVTNVDGVPLRCVFVVGDGDFNSQIVTGELRVAESIQTTSLDTSALPVVINKTIGLVDAERVELIANSTIGQTDELPTVDEGFHVGSFVFDGHFWSVSETNLREWDLSGNLISNRALNTRIGGFILGAAVDERGNIYVAHNAGIDRVNMLNMSVDQLAVNITSFGLGAFYRQGHFYINTGIPDGNGQLGIVDYDIAENTQFVFNVGLGGSGASNALSYDHQRDHMLLSNLGSNNYDVIDINARNATGEVRMLPASSAALVLLPEFNTAISTQNNRLLIHNIDATSYNATLYIQDGENVATRREFRVAADIDFFPRSNGVVMRGQVLNAILQGLNIGADPGDRYLDYIVSINYFDGRNTVNRSAGSATFAFRGYSDDMELFLESSIELRVMPEFLGAV